MTHDCCAKLSTNHIIKYADDAKIMGFIRDNDEWKYRKEVKLFTKWCSNNNLFLNVEKTKELVINFRKKGPTYSLVYINNTAVETVQQVKFLGVHVTENLTWSLHSTCLAKKAHQQLHFLRRLRRAHLSPSIPTTFYRGAVESVLINGIYLWYENSRVSDKNTLK